ncbi:glycosyltransferase family 4 protein, partial [Patescibacteria group bacterium]|nr:glycosyltransferase family 4 protein [Patescibacteria group bacterium]
DFDIIHIHGVGPALLAWLPKIFARRAKVVVTFHCIDRKHQKWGRFARFALRLGEYMACRFSDRTITVSRSLNKYCAEVYDVFTEYIPNGITQNPIVGHDKLKNFNLEPKEYILAVSRLVPHKGIHYLIKAYKDLKERKPEIIGAKKLAIVGGSAFTDDYVKELKDLADGDKDIIFTDYQSGESLFQLYKNAYLYVHPSESEGLPTSILEAMSWRVPVLASNIRENMEAVQDFGIVFENKNIKDLVKKLEQYLPRADYLADLGSRSCEFVYKNYNWQDIGKDVLGLYFDLNPEIKFELESLVCVKE